MEGFCGIGVAVGDVDLACEALVAGRHGPHALGNEDAFDPRAWDEAHPLNHIQSTRSGQVVDEQLRVLARESKHVNLPRSRHGICEARVHRSVGLERLAQVATRRFAQLFAAELLNVQGVEQRHALGTLLKHNIRRLKQHPWLQGHLEERLTFVQHIHRGVAHHAHAERVWVATHIELKKPKRVRHRPHPTSFPHHRRPGKRIEGFLADVCSRRVVVSRMVLGRKNFSSKGFLRAGFRRPTRKQRHASADQPRAHQR